MWRIVKNGALASLNWRKQAPFGPYILDFVSHPARLVVEADGGQHNQPEQSAHDRERTIFLESQGYRVLRFWNNEILTNADGVFRVIIDAASKSAARPRMERWKTERQAAFAAQVANLLLDGGGGERMRAGGGDRAEQSELPLEAQPQNAERTPPPSLFRGGEVRVQPSKSR
jgi:very-short-patch-repair endonuclease